MSISPTNSIDRSLNDRTGTLERLKELIVKTEMSRIDSKKPRNQRGLQKSIGPPGPLQTPLEARILAESTSSGAS